MIRLLPRSDTPLKSARAAQDVVPSRYVPASTLMDIARDGGVA